MRIPVVRERVRVQGQDGAFLVVWVDRDRNTADLIPLVDAGAVLSVPFSQIQPLRDVQDDGSGI